MTAEFMDKCINIIVQAQNAGFHVDWLGNTIVLTVPGKNDNVI